MANNEPTIGQFMTFAPATVDEDLLLADACERMAIDNIRHLAVIDRAGQLVGVLSSGDVVMATSSGGRGKPLLVRDAMSENPYSCTPSAPLAEVALELESHRWGCVVVRDGAEIVGIFTTTDALRALRQLATGHAAAPAVTPTHLPPLGDHSTRRGPLRRHRPFESGRTGLFRAGR